MPGALVTMHVSVDLFCKPLYNTLTGAVISKIIH